MAAQEAQRGQRQEVMNWIRLAWRGLLTVKRSSGPMHTAHRARLPTTYDLLQVNAFASSVLDTTPGFENHVFDVVRHGHVVQARSGLVARLIRPLKELERSLGLGRLVLGLVHQDEGGAGNGPCGLTGLIGQNLVEALAPVGTGRSGLE